MINVKQTLAQLIEKLAQSNNQKVSISQLENILHHIDPSKNYSNLTLPKHRESKHLSIFISKFHDQQTDNDAFIEENCSQWRENSSLFWKDASFSISASSGPISIRQLSKSIDNFEATENLNPMRRRISLLVFFRLEEQIQEKVRSLVISAERRLQAGLKYQSIALSIIVENICESRYVTQNEKVKIRDKINRRLRIGKRYAQLQDDMLLKLGKLPGKLMQV